MPNYDFLDAAYNWAKQTLNGHRKDKPQVCVLQVSGGWGARLSGGYEGEAVLPKCWTRQIQTPDT